MAVAHNQIKEILTAMLRYVPSDQVTDLLSDLSYTEAYKRNASFRETVLRLKAQYEKRKARS